MKILKQILTLYFVILCVTNSFSQSVISNNGMTFSPDTLHVTEGDTIHFTLGASHNAVEVDAATFLSNDTMSNGGFNIPFGGGSFIADSIQTYYYVCKDHAFLGMKGVIISSCNKNVTQASTGFNPNPVYSAATKSYDTLTFTNTSNCDIRLRPEFTISKDNGPIGATDLTLKLWNSSLGVWANLPYAINGNGDAIGSLGYPLGDTTGIVVSAGAFIKLPIRVKFNGGSGIWGRYCAIWETKEVDPLGNVIQNLTIGTNTCLDFVNCSNFGVDSSYITHVTCFNGNDGNAGILSIQNGSGTYLYNWDNGNNSNATSNLVAGNHYCIITDLNWQQCTDSIGFVISEPPALSATYTQTNISCFGGNDVSAII